MQCPGCGIDVSEHQKFCAECGTALHPVTAIDPDLDTQQLAAVGETVDDPDEASSAEPALADDETVDESEPGSEPDPAAEPTEPIEVVTPPPLLDTDEPTTETPLPPPSPSPSPSPSPVWIDTTPTTPIVAADPVDDDVYQPTTTEELPALFDGSADLVEYPTPREPFRLRISFLLAVFGAGAMLMAIVADVIDIRTTRPASGITTGVRVLDDLGSNLALAGVIGVAVMVVGTLLSCFGLRWGAGLGGGAGLAIVGWADLTIGLAELPIAIAESITRTSSEAFTLRVTRDLGWWLIAGVGIVGLLVFVASLRSISSGGRPALNPIVAALTAVAAVILAAGPLVPVGNASFADNFRSTDPERDLPTAFFAGRLIQVGLIALAGVVGMLIVRSYGLGLAAGGVSVGLWLWVSSLVELGDEPVGIAYRNPGAADSTPHAVTTVGMVLTLVMLAVAAALGTYRLTRNR